MAKTCSMLKQVFKMTFVVTRFLFLLLGCRKWLTKYYDIGSATMEKNNDFDLDFIITL